MKLFRKEKLVHLFGAGVGLLFLVPSLTMAASFSVSPSSGSHQSGVPFTVTVSANGGSGESILTGDGSISATGLNVLSASRLAPDCIKLSTASFTCSVAQSTPGGVSSFPMFSLTLSGSGNLTIGGVIYKIDPASQFGTSAAPTQNGTASFSILTPTPTPVVNNNGGGGSTGTGSTSGTSTSSTSSAAKTSGTTGTTASSGTTGSTGTTATTGAGDPASTNKVATTAGAVKGAESVNKANSTGNKFLGLSFWIWALAALAFSGAAGYAYWRRLQFAKVK